MELLPCCHALLLTRDRFEKHVTPLLCMTAIILMTCVPFANGQSSEPAAPDVSHLKPAATWLAADQVDIDENPLPVTDRALRIPLTYSSKYIPSMPHGRYLLVTAGSNEMGSIYDLLVKKIYRKMPSMNVDGLAILSPDATRLAGETKSGSNRSIVIASIAPPRPLANIQIPHRNAFAWLAFANNNQHLLAMSHRYKKEVSLIAYDVKTTQIVWQIDGSTQNIKPHIWAMSPSGRYLALVHQPEKLTTGSIKIHDTTTGLVVGEIDLTIPGGGSPKITGMSINHDGKLMGILCEPDNVNSYVLLYDMATGQPLEDMPVGEMPQEVRYRSESPNDLNFIDDHVLLVKDQLVLQRGKPSYVDLLPQSHEERELPLRTAGRANVLRITAGSNKTLFTQSVNVKQIDDMIAKRDELIAQRTVILPEPMQPDVSRPLTQGPLSSLALQSGWQATIDPADPALAQLLNRPVELQGIAGNDQLVIAPTGKAIITLPKATFPDPNTPAKPTDLPPDPMQMTYVDVTRPVQKLLDFKLPPTTLAGVLSPAGSRCMVSTGRRVDFYDLPEGSHVSGFEMVDAQGTPLDVAPNARTAPWKQAMFLGEELILIQTEKQVLVWSIRDATLRWSLDLSARRIALTPGGQYLLINSDSNWHLVDSQTGRSQGSFSFNNSGAITSYCFSTDGRQFFAYQQGSLYGLIHVLDMTTGKFAPPVHTSNLASNVNHMHHVQDNWVFINSCLVDLQSGAAIWQYSGIREVIDQNVSSQLWLMTRDHHRKSTVIRGVNVITPDMTNQLAGSVDFKPLFGRGSKLSTGTANMSESGLKELSQKMLQAGITLAADAPFKLEAEIHTETLEPLPFVISKTSPGVPRSLYNITGKLGPNDSLITVNRFKTTRSLKMLGPENQVLWSTTSSAQTRTDGFTFQEGVDPTTILNKDEHAMRVNDYSGYVYSIPTLIYPPTSSTLRGHSALTSTGFQPTPMP